jgi:UDP-N-acetylmuramate--alanine ligase
LFRWQGINGIAKYQMNLAATTIEPSMAGMLRARIDFNRQNEVPPTHQPTAYLLGIAGAGMRSMAMVLEQLGWRIVGSDLGDTRLLPAQWQILAARELPPLASGDVVIYSPAVDVQHPMLEMARRLGYLVLSYPAMLGRLMQSGMGIAIAGTHGKSTVTAMVASILRHAELSPTVVLGAEAIVPSAGSGAGDGLHVVVEACEYRGSFLKLRPSIAAILNMEWDHCDWFDAPDDVVPAFVRFAGQVVAGGTLVVPYGNWPGAKPQAAEVLTFGCDRAADVHCRQLFSDGGQYTFELVLQGQSAGHVKLQIPGYHNLQNALAAAAVAFAAGVQGPEICAGLNQFAGLRRRLEYLGMAGGVHFIDDFAHHPTEIAAALATVRQKFASSRVWCIFEPHQASRTKSLLSDLAFSLQNTDTLAIGKIFRARENPAQPPQVTEADLADACRGLGAQLLDEHDLTALEHALIAARRQGNLVPGDVLVTLGAGRIGILAHGVFQRFREHFTHG